MEIKKLVIKIIIILSIGLLVYACANKAQGPTGGPKDETPPRVMKSTPLNGALNFKKKEIQIIFDENITVEKPNEIIIISPPQAKQPDVKGNAKVVSVSFEDELKDSTTYTINFGNSIVDLNEKNPLVNYRFAFSTGNEIDTLQISGTLINAEDLNPVSGVIVGIYSENNDSVFFKKPFLRIGKTDENGRFTVDNCKPGKYRIYALGDVSKDYFYQPGENVAFIDSLVSPFAIQVEKQDTSWKDTVTIDTVKTITVTRFLPDNLLFKYFKENKKRQYFVKSERKKSQSFTLFFNTTAAQLPEIKPLNFDWKDKEKKKKNATLDTLTYWLRDSLIFNIDTLTMKLTYQKTDSIFQLVPQTDTINVIMRKSTINTKAKSKKQAIPEMEFYKVSTNASSGFELYNPLLITFDAPLDSIDLSKLKLQQKIDSTFKTLPLKWRQVDSTRMAYAIDYKWEPEKLYELHIDSAAIKSIYNLKNNKLKADLKIKSLDEYSALKILQATYDSLIVFQLLDTKDNVIALKKAQPKGTLFEYLKPGDFYLRAFTDKNQNGKWDTGDISTRTQPEEMYYYPEKFSLRANWEFEETWDINAVPLLEQKPAELKKDSGKKQGN